VKCLLPIHHFNRGFRLSNGAAAREPVPRLVECQAEGLSLENRAPFGCKTDGLGIDVSAVLRATVRIY